MKEYPEKAFDGTLEIPQYYVENDSKVHYTINFYTQQIGSLDIPTGKIIVTDILTLPDNTPLNVTFPIGKFPVQLAIGVYNYSLEEKDERVGFARIKFDDSLPVRWEMALLPEQNIEDLKEDEIFGYGVDSGTGSFLDYSNHELIQDFMDSEEGCDIIFSEMDTTYKHTRSWYIWSENKVAIFSSGTGDGFYASYIGYNENNNIGRLVTDFSIFFLE